MTESPTPLPRSYRLLINGNLTDAQSGDTVTLAARSGEPFATVALAAPGDLRSAIESAQDGFAHWSALSAPERGDALWALAETLESLRDDLVDAVRATGSPHGAARVALPAAAARKEVDTALRRLVCFAGWTDKFGALIGGQDAVAGSHDAFSSPAPAGVIGVIGPNTPSLLGPISLLAPPLCAGNSVVLVASTESAPPVLVLAEACANSDIPGGAINIVTGPRSELIAALATDRSVDAVSAANLSAADLLALRRGAAENLSRVRHVKFSREQWNDGDRCESPATIEPFVSVRTVWHPALI